MSRPAADLNALATAMTLARYQRESAQPSIPIGWIMAGIVLAFVALVGVKGCQ